MNAYIDFHTHILPGIDDGSPDTGTSLAMIAKLAEQGVGKIVLTSHYYSDELPMEEYLLRRDAAFEELLPRCPAGIDLIPASATFVTEYIFNNADLRPLCVGARYLLTEWPYTSSFTGRSARQLERLQSDYGLTPIIAHVERYPALIGDRAKLEDLAEAGCLFQINLASLRSRGTRRVLTRLISDGLIHLVGTDCHNLTTRPPEYQPGIEWIEKKCGSRAVERLIEKAEALLQPD